MAASSESPRRAFSRRSLLIGAVGAAGLGAGGAAMEYIWKKKDIRARLFNPFTLADFDLPPVPELIDAAGKPVPGLSSADLAGKRCLLNVWASWCPVCRAEHKHLVALAQRNLAPIYGADVKDAPARVRYFLAKNGNPFTALGADTESFLQRALGLRGVPGTFVIGPGHVIEWSTNEGLTEAIIEKEIAPRLAIKEG